MNKLTKRLAAMGAAIMMMASMSAMGASAEVYGHKSATNMGVSFNDDWEKTLSFSLNTSDGTASVSAKVGYDTWCQNEDYITKVYAPTGWRHRGRVENGSAESSYTAWLIGGSNTGKADIEHTTKYVDYWIYVDISK